MHDKVLFFMTIKRLLFIFCLFVLTAVPRFLTLDAHWSSDERLWLSRSAEFISSVKAGDFSDTRIAYHPGVTTMWIAGLRAFFIEPRIDIENLVYSRRYISFIISVCIVVSFFIVNHLFGRWVAYASFALLAFSPFFLAQTRRVHTDALATSFIFLTVLLFLLYCQNRECWAYLIISGFVFGLALLSKSYALILLPWVLLCQFLFREKSGGSLFRHIAEFLCFLNSTLLCVLVIYPVYWSPFFGITSLIIIGVTVMLLIGIVKKWNPLIWILVSSVMLVLICIQMVDSLSNVIDSINWAVTTPHEVEHFFLGKVVNDPGWLFYLFVLSIKSTPLMLPLAAMGCILLCKKRKQTDKTHLHFRMSVALVLGVLLFIFCLSVTSKKFSRYLLPTFLFLELLASIGLVEILRWSFAALRTRIGIMERCKKAFTVIACVFFFSIEVLPVFALHPYYGTHYNLSWKVTDITKIITVGDGLGLDIAAKYLNGKQKAVMNNIDRVPHMVVQVSPLATEIFGYYYRDYIYSADLDAWIRDAADYEVVYIRDSQIGLVPETGTLNGTLENVITLNGIDYVRIYRIQRK